MYFIWDVYTVQEKQVYDSTEALFEGVDISVSGLTSLQPVEQFCPCFVTCLSVVGGEKADTDTKLLP